MVKQTANRLLALLLAMMMTLSLAACGNAPQTGITDGSVYAFRKRTVGKRNGSSGAKKHRGCPNRRYARRRV